MANLYALYDKVAEHYSHFMLAENDAMYVRELIAHRIAFPLNFQDTVPVRYTDFDENACEDVSWTAWKSPETKAELLAPLGLSHDETIQVARKKLEEQIAELRARNDEVPQAMLDELNLYIKR